MEIVVKISDIPVTSIGYKLDLQRSACRLSIDKRQASCEHGKNIVLPPRFSC